MTVDDSERRYMGTRCKPTKPFSKLCDVSRNYFDCHLLSTISVDVRCSNGDRCELISALSKLGF